MTNNETHETSEGLARCYYDETYFSAHWNIMINVGSLPHTSLESLLSR